ncbi:DUF4374 domain-containing protein [Chitinophaga lutea]
MTRNLAYTAAIAGLALTFGACSKNDKKDSGGLTAGGRYVIAVSPVATTGVADYLLTAEDLTKGTISTAGNGVEQDGTYRYYVTHNEKFFSMLYGQGNPGAVTAYNVKGGKLTKLTNFQTETVQAFAPVNNDILMIKIPRSQTGGDQALWYRVDSDKLLIAAEGQTNVQAMTGTAERAHFTWITQVGDKVFAPYQSILGCCGDSFGTNYPDSAWVAVYSYPSMTLEKVIRDDRTSYIGRYFTDGLGVDESGDVYGFSSAVATQGGVLTSTKPSAYVRIKKGAAEFDKSYYFNVQEASGGYVVTNHTYVGDGNFVVLMAKTAEKGAYVTGKYFGVVNVHNKTFGWIAGMPEADKIAGVTTNNYSPKDGRTAYVGVTLADGSSFVYKLDAAARTGVQGLKVEGGKITAINRVESKS